MLDKIIAQIVLILLGWLEKRMQSSKTAADADVDLDRLRIAGSRIDEWLREQQNNIHSRGITHEVGSTSKD